MPGRAPHGTGPWLLRAIVAAAALSAGAAGAAAAAAQGRETAASADPGAPGASAEEAVRARFAEVRRLVERREEAQAAFEEAVAKAPPETETPALRAAHDALARADEALARALAALDLACGDPATGAVLVGLFAGEKPASPLVDAVAGHVARRGGEAGGAALVAAAEARGDAPGAALVDAIGAAAGPRAWRYAAACARDLGRDRALRLRAVAAMGASGRPEAAALLADALRDGDAAIASAAAEAFRRVALPEAEALPALRARLEAAAADGRTDRRLLAAGAAARLPYPHAIAVLQPLLDDPAPGVAAGAIAALGGVDDRAVDAVLVARLADPARPVEVRRAAVAQVGRRRAAQAVAPLVELLLVEELKEHAALALRRITGETLPASHAAWAGWLERRDGRGDGSGGGR